MTTADQVRRLIKFDKSLSSQLTPLLIVTPWQLAIVNQTLLGDGESAIVLADAGLVKDWKKTQRLAVIVVFDDTHALFVYNVKALPVNDVTDLTIDTVLPIDNGFTYVCPSCCTSYCHVTW